jgi:hypothetical protein
VLLRWAVQRGTVPLPRSTNAGRIAENLAGARGSGSGGGSGSGSGAPAGAGGEWRLSEAEMAALDALDAGSEKGRIMKGDNFAREGEHWREVWDADWVAPPAPAGRAVT